MEDWAALARAIRGRMSELGLTQRELIERSQVSKATVGELYHNSAQRRRSARTLEALSTALGWHPRHLVAVLNGQRAPDLGEPVSRSDDDVLGRLAAIEYRLTQIEAQLGAIDELNDRLDQINANVEAVISFVDAEVWPRSVEFAGMRSGSERGPLLLCPALGSDTNGVFDQERSPDP